MNIYPKFKDQVNNLMYILRDHGYSDKALNKREAKSGGYWNDYQDRKAIESDLIRIFSSRATGRSFAFGFYYTDLEKPYIMVSFKKNQSEEGSIVSSKYSPEKFKEKLNSFVQMMSVLSDTKKLDSPTIEKTYILHFLKGQEFDADAEIQSVLEGVKGKVLAAKERNAELIKEEAKLLKKLKKSEEVVENVVQKEREKTNVLELKKQFEEASQKCTKKKRAIEKSEKLDETKESLREVRKELREHKDNLATTLKSEIRHLPPYCHDRLNAEVDKLLKENK